LQAQTKLQSSSTQCPISSVHLTIHRLYLVPRDDRVRRWRILCLKLKARGLTSRLWESRHRSRKCRGI
jgi:hypothetical protein